MEIIQDLKLSFAKKMCVLNEIFKIHSVARVSELLIDASHSSLMSGKDNDY